MGYFLVFLVAAMLIIEGLAYMLEKESRQNSHRGRT
jgi:hypothetical protein